MDDADHWNSLCKNNLYLSLFYRNSDGTLELVMNDYFNWND